MDKERNLAAVDNDFVLHLVETDNLPTDVFAAISMLFDELNVNPVMHELVYKNELNCNGATLSSSQQNALKLFSLGTIQVKLLADIISAPGADVYYAILFKEIYNKFSKKPLPSMNVLTDWVTQSSLGEVHSVVMCFFVDCGIFLSDDREAQALKTYLNESTGFVINIYNRRMACERAKEIGSGEFPRKVRKALSHD